MSQSNEPAVDIKREYSVEEPVPQEARHYGFWDMVFTWIGANANTSSWYTGGVVAAVGVLGGLAVIFVANPIAYAVMALIGFIGYKVGTTTMGLTRASFGIRGSILPSTLNAVQFVGWCSVNTFLAAISMSYLFQMAFGWPAFGEEGSAGNMILGVLICSVLQILMVAISGSHSIKIAERVATILLVVLTVWETVVILKNFDIATILAWTPPADVRMPFGAAMDVMVAFSFGWIPAICEFTRYTKNKSSAIAAPMIGANVALFWFAIVGLLGVVAMATETGTFDPNMSDPSTIMATLGLGWVAMIILIVATCTTNCINIYASSMSLNNLFPRVGAKKMILIVAVITVAGSLVPVAIGSLVDYFMVFLSYVGLIFAPLLPIIILDYYVVKKRDYDWSHAAKVGGKYWYSGGVNWRAIASWAIGVVFYFVAMNIDFIMNSLGAIYATVIVTAVVYLIVVKVAPEKIEH
ncbi:MAG: cytosine permease [Clostridiales Family XIII bacterium]|jgi:putative hydroxymethylpyrimidine transporter CytX|nr:cytosine permease [Clostridiales Family XIII bacterium]